MMPQSSSSPLPAHSAPGQSSSCQCSSSQSGPPRQALPAALCCLALASALPLALGSLVDFGVWSKADLLPLWLHLSAAVGSLGLVIGLLLRNPATGSAVRHPLVLLPAALGLWSVVVAPFVDLPALSLAGTAQSGHGALWFFDSAALTACGLVLRHGRSSLWRGLVLWAIGVAAAIAALKTVDLFDPNNHLLIYVAAYYAWIGLALAALVMTLQRPDGTPALALRLVGLAVAASLLVVSKSATAMGIFAVAAMYYALVWLNERHSPGRFRLPALLNRRAVPVTLVIAAAVLPYLALRWIPALGQIESLRDRQLLQQMMHAALAAQEPWVWITGHGWGQIQDAFRTNLNVTGETLWNPTWIFLSSDYFHPHNWILESLHAAGIPGALLFLAGLIGLPLFAARQHRAVAGGLALAVAAMYSLWFDISLSVPFMALATAALAAPPKAGGASTADRKGTAALAVLPALHAVAAVTTTLAIVGFLLSVQAVRGGASDHLRDDPRGNDIALTTLLVQDTTASLLSPAARPQAIALLRKVEERIPHTRSAYFLVTVAGLYDRLYLTGELAPLAPLVGPGAPWTQTIERLLQIAPGRTDATIGYLTYHAVHSNSAETERIASQILATAPQDPVGLYFKGLTQVLRPDAASKAYGISLLRQSKTYGIERFMPLDPQILSLIQPAP